VSGHPHVDAADGVRAKFRSTQELDFRRLRCRRPSRWGDLQLIQTARLNDLDPQAWLADILARLQDHPAKRIGEFLSWNWKRERAQKAAV
jgi:hypothetical protein